MKYTFQHFVDIKTSADSMQIIQINAGGSYMLQRIKHLIGAFKYMKMGKISIKLIPASTLPVDPLGLSYDDSDPQTIDPRDQMNPGLVRITNGEDLFTDVASLTETQQMQIYNNMMLDPRWSKFMLQSGFKRTATPLYWQIGQLHQDYYPGATLNVPRVSTGTSEVLSSTDTEYLFDKTTTGGSSTLSGYRELNHSDPRGLFQVGHRGKMGWIPTDALVQYSNNSGVNLTPSINAMPSIGCITCVLPKMFKTLYYYRMFITETVYLSGLKNTGVNGPNEGDYRGIDNFVIGTSTPQLPSTNIIPVVFPPNTKNDGEL